MSFKSMFGTTREPMISFSLPEISLKAQDMVGKLSISGVQPKLSVKFDKRSGELVPAPEGGEYILKPQPQTFPHLPQNEQCCMDIAQALGIDIPEHCLLPLTDGSFAYVVKRFDRQSAQKIHQEDFSQILGKDKYDGSVEQIGRKLKEISSVPGLDVQLFFERVVLNFLLGNGDAHLKNYSINYHKTTQIRLSPAYDIVSSKLAIPDEREESALAINGKKNRLSREDFDAVAEHLQIPVKVRYEKFIGQAGHIKGLINVSKLNAQEQKSFNVIVKDRYQRINF
ncbi:MAG: HipA domain-containing protein [Candidatus Omnitrophota bacterium]|nr:HipA domain-containing protein [Candidatus Omnitrophota bacterium]